MLVMQERNSAGSFVRYLQVDSSPQAGRDYLNIISASIDRSVLPRLLWIAHFFYNEPLRLDSADEELVEKHEKLQAECRDAIVLHRHPTVQIGMGRGSVADKLAATTHSFRLENSSNAQLTKFVREFHSSAPDLGTESKFNRSQPVPPSDLALSFSAVSDFLKAQVKKPAAPVSHDISDVDDSDVRAIARGARLRKPLPAGDFSDVEDALAPAPPAPAPPSEDPDLLEYDRMILNPGSAHIVHNASNILKDCMHSYALRTSQLKEVCNLIRKPQHLKRLLATCFPSDVDQVVAKVFKGFKGRVHAVRFATTCYAFPEAIRVGPALRFGWRSKAFLAGKAPRSRKAEDEHDTKAFFKVLDGAIPDPLFWAWLVVGDAVACFIRFAMRFVTSCGCHWKLQQDLVIGMQDDNPWHRRLWNVCQNCPGGGRRSLSFSSGELFAELGEQQQVLECDVLAKLDPEIQEKDRSDLLREFGAGVHGLRFHLTLKYHHWAEEPWIIYKTPSPSRAHASIALRQVLASSSPHPAVRDFQVEPVRQQAERFIEGEELFQGGEVRPGMRALATLMASAYWSWTLEWLGETEHARTRRDSRAAPHYDEAFISFNKRWSEVQSYMSSSEAAAKQFLECLDRVEYGKNVARALGLAGHPALCDGSAGRIARSMVLRHLVYHAHDSQIYGERAKMHLCKPSPVKRDSPEGDTAAAAAQFTEHASTSWHTYAVQHVLEVLSGASSSSTDVWFSVPMKEKTVTTLTSMLSGSAELTHLQDLCVHLPPLEGDVVGDQLQGGLPANLANMLFLKAMACNVSRLTRPRVEGETELLTSDVGITLHQIEDMNLAEQRINVNTEARSMVSGGWGDDPLLLSLHNFSVDELEKAWLWKPVGKLTYRVRDMDKFTDLMWYEPDDDEDCVSGAQGEIIFKEVVQSLGSQPSGYSVHPSHASAPAQLLFLKVLQRVGWVKEAPEDPTAFVFTEEGRREVLVLQTFRLDRRLLQIRDGIALVDKTVWELMIVMWQAGWQHRHWTQHGRPDAFAQGSPRVWYTRRQDPLMVWSVYLAALLTESSEHRWPIEHFESKEYYAAWLDGKPLVSKPRRAAAKRVSDSMCDLTGEEASRPKPVVKPRRAAAVKKLRKPCEASESDCAPSASESDCTPSAEDESTDEEEAMEDESASKPPSAPEADEEDSAENNDEKDTAEDSSTSSSSSSSSSDSSSGGAPQLPPDTLAQEENPPKRRRGQPRQQGGRGQWLACFHITPKGNPAKGWQCKCLYEGHTHSHVIKGAKSQCSRAANFDPGNPNSQQAALLYLKTWCLRADQHATRAEHQKNESHAILNVEAYMKEADLDAAILARYSQ